MSQVLALMDYIYQGEVNVLQEELGEFLLLAKELQLKGLLAGSNKADSFKKSVSEEEPPPSEILEEQGSEKIIKGLLDESQEKIIPILFYYRVCLRFVHAISTYLLHNAVH